ncbi:hypothetical protein J4Q44_G00274180 [Coregonus suidteri]|uniref:Uncharacterized protein n=1 Tax=Coregonus suidteri TaxID=861788 RepID=A0AAN8QM96_9TELE
MAVERLLRIIKDKGEAAVRVLCTDFEVPMFNPSELTFLTEYAATMSPVTKAMNILQAETNVQIGRASATCFNTLSTTTWTKDDATIRMEMDYIKDHLEEPLLQLGDGTSSSDEEDFFSAMKTS